MKFLQLFITTYLIHIVNSTFEQCDENEKCLETENKYSKDKNNPIFKTYLDQIHKAVLDYVPCNSSDCSCYFSNINNDLKLFKSNKISKKVLDSARNKGTKYQIINHRLYREKDCMFPTRCSGIEYFLLKLISTLPNMDLIINTRDWPQISKYQNTAPIFSFSKTRDYIDIMYPAWSFWGGGPAISLYPKGLGRWDLLREKLKNTAVEIPWEKKENKAFFRGSRTSAERDAIVLLSRESPNLVDAQYTKNQAWRSPADTLNAPPAEEVSFEGHCKYRYLFNFRGVAASFRFKHLFLCKSLVFHVGDEWKEFFYSELKPWVHYIPVNKDASKEELKQLIEFVMSNENVAKEIAERGFNFIWEHLQFKDVLCYWKTLLKRYAKLLDYTPELDMSLNEIKKAS